MTERPEGTSPSDNDADEQEEFEDRMLDRDRAVSEEHDLTAEGLRRGEGLEERLREERNDRGTGAVSDVVPAELDETDDEGDMVADPSLVGSEDGPFTPAEEGAIHVVEDPPGATDHPDDLTEW
jgi:hypothetical protein